jgi:DNA-binding MurR/RpiR family transcriptional regulator
VLNPLGTNNQGTKMSELDDRFFKIKSSLTKMSPTQKRIAQYIMVNAESVKDLSITRLSRKIGVDSAAISRFCQFLGYKGYADFRFSLSHHLVSSLSEPLVQYAEEDSVSDILVKMKNNFIHIWQDIFELLDPKLIEQAARNIYNSKNVYIYSAPGTVTSALFAQKMFLQTGIQCSTYNDVMFSIPASEHLSSRDTVIGISFSGMSKMVIESVKLAKEKKATVIGITGFQTSELKKLADINICFNSRIPDDLRYQHMIFFMEITVIAMIQNTILTQHYKELSPVLQRTIDIVNMVRY